MCPRSLETPHRAPCRKWDLQVCFPWPRLSLAWCVTRNCIHVWRPSIRTWAKRRRLTLWSELSQCNFRRYSPTVWSGNSANFASITKSYKRLVAAITRWGDLNGRRRRVSFVSQLYRYLPLVRSLWSTSGLWSQCASFRQNSSWQASWPWRSMSLRSYELLFYFRHWQSRFSYKVGWAIESAASWEKISETDQPECL